MCIAFTSSCSPLLPHVDDQHLNQIHERRATATGQAMTNKPQLQEALHAPIRTGKPQYRLDDLMVLIHCS